MQRTPAPEKRYTSVPQSKTMDLAFRTNVCFPAPINWRHEGFLPFDCHVTASPDVLGPLRPTGQPMDAPVPLHGLPALGQLSAPSRSDANIECRLDSALHPYLPNRHLSRCVKVLQNHVCAFWKFLIHR